MVKNKETKKRAGKFIIIGIVLTLFNFGLYTLIARLIINNNDFLWLSTLLSTLATTFLAYFLHSKITWKERDPGKLGIIKFFIWNLLAALIIGPFLTWIFGMLKPLYDLAYNISSTIHLPFDYDFIQSTGAFCLTSVVTMILNYFFYDKLVFGSSKKEKEEKGEKE